MARWMNEYEADTARYLLNEAGAVNRWYHTPRKGWHVWVHFPASDESAFLYLLREVRAYLKTVNA